MSFCEIVQIRQYVSYFLKAFNQKLSAYFGTRINKKYETIRGRKQICPFGKDKVHVGTGRH